MKTRDAAEVALSIMGVFKIATAVLRLPPLVYYSYMYMSSPIGKQLLAESCGEFAANLVVGILLVLMARRIADWIVRRSASLATADVDLRIVSPEGFRFCLKLVGIAVLIQGVATLVKWDTANIIAGALVLALGIYLIRGGGWLTRFAWGKAGA
jgi:hypothetical protein